MSKSGTMRKNPRGGPGFFSDGSKPVSARNVTKRLLIFLKDFRLSLIMMFVTVCASTLFAVVAPNLQSKAIDIIAKVREGSLMHYVLLMLLAYVMCGVLNFAMGVISARVGQRLIGRLRDSLFEKYVNVSVGFLDKNPHGDLLSRMSNDVENLSTVVSMAIPSLLQALLTIIGTAGFMLYLCYPLALVTFVAIFITFFATRYLAAKVRKYSKKRQSLLGSLNSVCEESINCYRTLTAYGVSGRAVTEFNKTSDLLTHNSIKTEIYAGVMGPVMNCIGNLEFFIIVIFGALFALYDVVTVGVISAFIVYAKLFSRPVNEISMIYGQIQSALAGAERVFAILDEKNEEESLPGGDDRRQMPKETRSPLEDTVVEFSHVDFSYDKNIKTITDFTLKGRAGDKIALIGPTGSGKTTIGSLILGFYRPDNGFVRILGHDTRFTPPSFFRRHIAVVPQDTCFFTDTLRYNLTLGRTDITDEDIYRALTLFEAKSIVEKMPEGLATVLDNAGHSLSLGQRQLFSIVRAFLGDPRIIILDEATSSIDPHTETLVRRALNLLTKDRTSIIIAHRLTTVKDASLIVYMQNGRIVEQGLRTRSVLKKLLFEF